MAIAQLVEHLVVVQGVAGSSPVSHPIVSTQQRHPTSRRVPFVLVGPQRAGRAQGAGSVPRTLVATTSAATCFAAAESGPGWGTSIAAR